MAFVVDERLCGVGRLPRMWRRFYRTPCQPSARGQATTAQYKNSCDLKAEAPARLEEVMKEEKEEEEEEKTGKEKGEEGDG
ncbi:uncharacterized protein LOC143037237 isoform X3 [Oratosquilla oratoria]|uniref:uncharacterized protein LOC143037237 isoform X3 n=1 Tax=Oratosquilla oratoria TaxID=337810 RepID=UPI003F774F06